MPERDKEGARLDSRRGGCAQEGPQTKKWVLLSPPHPPRLGLANAAVIMAARAAAARAGSGERRAPPGRGRRPGPGLEAGRGAAAPGPMLGGGDGSGLSNVHHHPRTPVTN